MLPRTSRLRAEVIRALAALCPSLDFVEGLGLVVRVESGNGPAGWVLTFSPAEVASALDLANQAAAREAGEGEAGSQRKTVVLRSAHQRLYRAAQDRPESRKRLIARSGLSYGSHARQALAELLRAGYLAATHEGVCRGARPWPGAVPAA
jgi:hypothetical protein